MISEWLGMMGIGMAVAAAAAKTNDGRLDFSKIQAALANDPKVVAAESRVAAAKQKVTRYHEQVRRVLDPNDPATTPDQLTTRLPSALEDPHHAAVEALAEARRMAFRKKRPVFDAQLEADKAAVDEAYAALSQAMHRLHLTEVGINRIAPYGSHVVEVADEGHREGREHRGWRLRAFPKKPVHQRENISLLERSR